MQCSFCGKKAVLTDDYTVTYEGEILGIVAHGVCDTCILSKGEAPYKKSVAKNILGLFVAIVGAIVCLFAVPAPLNTIGLVLCAGLGLLFLILFLVKIFQKMQFRASVDRAKRGKKFVWHERETLTDLLSSPTEPPYVYINGGVVAAAIEAGTDLLGLIWLKNINSQFELHSKVAYTSVMVAFSPGNLNLSRRKMLLLYTAIKSDFSPTPPTDEEWEMLKALMDNFNAADKQYFRNTRILAAKGDMAAHDRILAAREAEYQEIHAFMAAYEKSKIHTKRRKQ